jgi:hypothetical protein
LLVAVASGQMNEKKMHHRFRSLRFRGEWFKPSSQLLKFIDQLKSGACTLQIEPVQRSDLPRVTVATALCHWQTWQSRGVGHAIACSDFGDNTADDVDSVC